MGELDELAETCGIHAGDGYLRNKAYRRELDISGSLEEESYYDNHVIPLFEKVFKTKIDGRFFPSRRTYGFVIREKRIIEKMHELGFPYGKKSTTVRVPNFIRNSKGKKIKNAFLRGFFDTDGCLSFGRKTGKYCIFKRTHNYYPSLILTTTSENLAKDLGGLLNELGVSFWCDVSDKRKYGWENLHRVWVKGRSVLDWMEKIGSKNPSKVSRYLIWKKYGHCPPNTTFAERLSILSGDIKIEQGPVW